MFILYFQAAQLSFVAVGGARLDCHCSRMRLTPRKNSWVCLRTRTGIVHNPQTVSTQDVSTCFLSSWQSLKRGLVCLETRTDRNRDMFGTTSSNPVVRLAEGPLLYRQTCPVSIAQWGYALIDCLQASLDSVADQEISPHYVSPPIVIYRDDFVPYSFCKIDTGMIPFQNSSNLPSEDSLWLLANIFFDS